MTLQQSADYTEQHASLPTIISATDADDQLKIIAIANGDNHRTRRTLSSLFRCRLSAGVSAFSNIVNKAKKSSKKYFGGYGGECQLRARARAGIAVDLWDCA
jgi:hypothetical protein